MNRFITLFFAAVVLFATTDRLPAPIQEVPEPTPAPTAAQEVKPKLPPLTRSNAKKQDVEKATQPRKGVGTATVFVYRPAGSGWGMFARCPITIDGAEPFNVANPRYVVKTLPPGKHVFEITGGILTHQRIPIEIDLESGQEYYIRMSLGMWAFPETKLLFARVPSAEGAQEVAKLRQR